MIYYEPVPISEHDALLGENFKTRFADEMQAYYSPFLTKNRDIKLAKETYEYAVTDSIDNAFWVGAGNNIIDVKTPNIEIDVKGLSCSTLKGMTTEASILQSLSSASDSYAKLFEDKDFASLKTMFVDPFIGKIKETKKLHVLCAVKVKQTQMVHYCLLRVVEKQNPNFINEMHMDAKRSVSLPMIDPKYGKTYLFIPKRRLEIRLNMNKMSEFSVFSHSVFEFLTTPLS